MVVKVGMAVLIAVALATTAVGPAPGVIGDTSANCSVPRGVPPTFESTCSLDTTVDVQPGSTLVIGQAPSSLTLPITGVDTGGACSGPSDQMTQFAGTMPFTLICPDGFSAGTSMEVTVIVTQPYLFRGSVTLTYNANTASPTTATATLNAGLPPLGTASYPAGWNLVGVPEGTILTGAVGPLYTLQAGDTSYETIPPGSPLHGGVGYWAYFPTPTSVTLNPAAHPWIPLSLPVQQWVMVGNPSQGPGMVSFATSLTIGQLADQEPAESEIYDPTLGEYTTVQPGGLLPGQGAWVWLPSGVSAAVGSIPIP
jgi:hypothetical protein